MTDNWVPVLSINTSRCSFNSLDNPARNTLLAPFYRQDD